MMCSKYGEEAGSGGGRQCRLLSPTGWTRMREATGVDLCRMVHHTPSLSQTSMQQRDFKFEGPVWEEEGSLASVICSGALTRIRPEHVRIMARNRKDKCHLSTTISLNHACESDAISSVHLLRDTLAKMPAPHPCTVPEQLVLADDRRMGKWAEPSGRSMQYRNSPHLRFEACTIQLISPAAAP